MKDPENFNPKFSPNLDKSQEFYRKEYNGFNQFLKEITQWYDKKEKRIQNLKKELEENS